jgi:regulator of cell morphogenesis and NO signaling
MITLSETTLVRELVARAPQTRPVFESFGIDYCCGGGRPLAAAAAGRGLAVGTLLAALRQALLAPPPAGEDYRDWSEASAGELADYIEKRHHAFMHRQLPRLEELMARVSKAHGARHGRVLSALAGLGEAIDAALTHHLYTEELVIFPLIRQLAGGAPPERRAEAQESLGYHLEHLEQEHQAAGRELERMRAVTSNYALPEDACESWKALYDGLAAVEADLHQHIHLENNVLFPKVRELLKPR